MNPRRVLSASWWFRTKNGKLVVAQFPSPPLIAWLALRVVRAVDVFPHHRDALTNAAAGALIAWGLDELVRGVNPFRRLLGAVVLGLEIRSLAG